MELADAFTELAYAKDWSPPSRRWFTSRLGAFFSWAGNQGATEKGWQMSLARHQT